MNDCPTRAEYEPGDVVLVEGVVKAFAHSRPYDEVTVDFPFATDESRLLDGVTAVVPQVSVVGCCTYTPDGRINYYTAEEGLYEEEV